MTKLDITVSLLVTIGSLTMLQWSQLKSLVITIILIITRALELTEPYRKISLYFLRVKNICSNPVVMNHFGEVKNSSLYPGRVSNETFSDLKIRYNQ